MLNIKEELTYYRQNKKLIKIPTKDTLTLHPTIKEKPISVQTLHVYELHLCIRNHFDDFSYEVVLGRESNLLPTWQCEFVCNVAVKKYNHT